MMQFLSKNASELGVTETNKIIQVIKTKNRLPTLSRK